MQREKRVSVNCGAKHRELGSYGFMRLSIRLPVCTHGAYFAEYIDVLPVLLKNICALCMLLVKSTAVFHGHTR